jgi:hypothetical protein
MMSASRSTIHNTAGPAARAPWIPIRAVAGMRHHAIVRRRQQQRQQSKNPPASRPAFLQDVVVHVLSMVR